jgi:hypothetical protein
VLAVPEDAVYDLNAIATTGRTEDFLFEPVEPIEERFVHQKGATAFVGLLGQRLDSASGGQVTPRPWTLHLLSPFLPQKGDKYFISPSWPELFIVNNRSATFRAAAIYMPFQLDIVGQASQCQESHSGATARRVVQGFHVKETTIELVSDPDEPTGSLIPHSDGQVPAV